MPITIGSNINSLKAQAQLEKGTSTLSRVFERLSSGKRINRASDDAAGLALADSLNADMRIYGQAQRNISDGLSVLSIAENALQQLSGILGRHRELAEQAANGTYTTVQRRALQKEADALTAEYNRIIETTEFNDVKLFDPNSPDLMIQAGVGTSASLTFGLGDDLERKVQNGVASAQGLTAGGNIYSSAAADFDGDGDIDLVTTNNSTANISIFLNNGNGTFIAPTNYTAGTGPRGVAAGDFNGDGVVDLATSDNTSGSISILLGNGNATFKARTSVAATAPTELLTFDANNDGFLDLVSGTSGANSFISISLGNGNGTFKAVTTSATGLTPTFMASGDINGDGITDLATANYASDSVSILLGTGNGTFNQYATYSTGSSSLPTEVALADYNRDGHLDFAVSKGGSAQLGIRFGQGNGSFGSETTLTTSGINLTFTSYDINSDGYTDIIAGQTASNNTFYGNGDGTFQASINGATGFFKALSPDINGDSVADNILTGLTSSVISIVRKTRDVATLAPTYILTREDARTTLDTLRAQHENVLSELSNVGAAQSRLEASLRQTQLLRENFAAAYSRIMDTDIAEESANLVRQRILQQTTAAILAQANQQPGLALQLLKQY